MAEESLERLPPEAKLAALDHAPIGIAIADAKRPDEPLVYVNDAFVTLTGYPRDEILGRNCRILQGPDTADEPVRRLRRGIDAGAVTTVELRNYRRDGEAFWNRVTVAPIRDEAGAVSQYVGFQVDVSERKDAERELRAERHALDRLVARIHGLLHDVTEQLMRAVTREETERAVCERVIAADPFVLAAFGEVDAGGEAIAISSVVGDGDLEAGDRFPLTEDHPVPRALADRRLQTTAEVDPRIGDGIGAIAVAPLYYRSREYGVLVCGARERGTFDGREQTVVEALGQTISIAINATESRRLISTDNVVELVFDVERGLLIAELAAACGANFTYEGTLAVAAGRTVTCYATDVTTDVVRDELAVLAPEVELRVLSETDDELVIGLEAPERALESEFVERGGELRSLEATPAGATVTVEALTAGNPRAIIDWFTDAYENVTVAAVRRRDRLPRTDRDVRGEMNQELTDKQAAALELAYVSGWYDDARPVTGSELAAVMGVSRATFHQHLRAAERKVMTAMLDR